MLNMANGGTVLRAAAAAINGDNWTRGCMGDSGGTGAASAYDRDGNGVLATDPTAVRMCGDVHIERKARELFPAQWEAALESARWLLCRHLGLKIEDLAPHDRKFGLQDLINVWNDHSNMWDVRKAIKDAAETFAVAQAA
jgi:hypothetical protein